MKKLIGLLGLLPLAAKAALFVASFTTVTATVTDTDGQAWTNGTWKAELVLPGGTFSGVTVTAGGVPVASPKKGMLDASGVMTARLTDTGSMDQAGVQWKITVCPNASVSPYGTTDCATYTTAATGTTVNLTSKFSFVTAPRFPAGTQAFGYSDVEAMPGVAGLGYFNTSTDKTIAGQRIWDGQRWVAGGGGGATPGGNNCNMQFKGDDDTLAGDSGTCTDGAGNVSMSTLTLATGPTQNLQAATKKYVDDAAAAAGNAAGNTYNPQYKGTDGKFAGDTNTIADGLGNWQFGGNATGKFVSSRAMARQWRSSNASTDGCQRAYNAGNLDCYAEWQTSPTDGGLTVNSVNPTAHMLDQSVAGAMDVMVNGMNVTFANTATSSPHKLFYWNNLAPLASGQPVGAYTVRAAGDVDTCVFANKGRNDAAATTISQWAVTLCHNRYAYMYGAGIHNYDGINMYCYSVGDCAMRYWYQHFRGGIQDASGEGVRGDAIQVIEDTSNATGTIASTYTGTGITKVKLNGDFATVGVAHYLVAKKAAKYTGTITNYAYSNGFALLTTSATITASPWIGSATVSPAVNSATNLDAPVVNSFAFTTAYGDISQVAVGKHVCLAATQTSEGEELVIQSSSVSGSTATLGLANKRIVGGFTYASLGSCDALDAANTRLVSSTGIMNPLMIVGYPSSNQMLVAFWAKGQLQTDAYGYLNAGTSCSVTISQTGTAVSATLLTTGSPSPNANACQSQYFARNTSATITGTTDFNGVVTPNYGDSTSNRALTWTSGTSATIAAETGVISLANVSGAFSVWPMAVIANVCDDATTQPVNAYTGQTACIDGTIDIENNSITFASGDAWEVPHYNAMRSNAKLTALTQDTLPFQTQPWLLQTAGAGIGANIMVVSNTTPNQFLGSGGRVALPPTVFRYYGANNGTIDTYAPTVPAGSAIYIHCASSSTSYLVVDCTNTPTFNVFRVDGQSNRGMAWHYNPSSGDSNLEMANGGMFSFSYAFQLANSNNAGLTYTPASVKPGALYYYTVDQRLRASDSTGTFHDIPWKDELATVATSGSYNDLSNKPSIPASQVNSDWNSSSGVSQILNKPNLAAVATSGSATDLSSGTLPAARMPAFSGGCTSSPGTTVLTCSSGIPSGTGFVRQSGTTTSVAALTGTEVGIALGYVPFSNQGGTISGNVSLSTHYISDVQDPVNPQDVATKHYVDTSPIASVSYSSDLATSRAYGTSYTNTSGHRIKVIWTGFDSGGSHACLLTGYVNGVELASVNAGATTTGSRFTVYLDVPTGGTYQVDTANSGGFTAATIAHVYEETF